VRVSLWLPLQWLAVLVHRLVHCRRTLNNPLLLTRVVSRVLREVSLPRCRKAVPRRVAQFLLVCLRPVPRPLRCRRVDLRCPALQQRRLLLACITGGLLVFRRVCPSTVWDRLPFPRQLCSLRQLVLSSSQPGEYKLLVALEPSSLSPQRPHLGKQKPRLVVDVELLRLTATLVAALV
jgi:hypothetical protein